MVRDARAAEYEDTPRPVIAIGNDYPDGHTHPPNSHQRCQLLYGARGVMIVATSQGNWVVPPQRAVWIPAGVVHAIRMTGPVSTRSIYIQPDAVPDMPDGCVVLGVSALMRSLLLEAVDLPTEYDPAGRDGLVMALLLQELRRLSVLPLSLSFPTDQRLARLCRAFLRAPDPHETIDDWSTRLGMSRRSFTRFFRQETGLSLSAWQRQACLLAALPRLAAGEAVTSIAMDLGYDSAAAFTAMFRRMLGVPPRSWPEAAQDSQALASLRGRKPDRDGLDIAGGL